MGKRWDILTLGWPRVEVTGGVIFMRTTFRLKWVAVVLIVCASPGAVIAALGHERFDGAWSRSGFDLRGTVLDGAASTLARLQLGEVICRRLGIVRVEAA